MQYSDVEYMPLFCVFSGQAPHTAVRTCILCEQEKWSNQFSSRRLSMTYTATNSMSFVPAGLVQNKTVGPLYVMVFDFFFFLILQAYFQSVTGSLFDMNVCCLPLAGS